jgi:glycerophosphoryl diester phosphodiesterase
VLGSALLLLALLISLADHASRSISEFTTTITAVGAEPATGPAIAVIAHRCNGGPYTQGTVDQCVAAVASGVTWIEGDVRWTGTGTAVSIHDPDLRAFGAPSVKVADVSFTQAARYVSPEHNNLSLITQTRDLVRVSGVQWMLEPKLPPTAAEWIALDSRLKPVKSLVTISSFDRAVVSEAIRRGYAAALNTYADVTAPPAGTGWVVQRASDIDAPTVAVLHAKGIKVACFSCNAPTVWADMKAKAVDAFITDVPADAQQWIDNH